MTEPSSIASGDRSPPLAPGQLSSRHSRMNQNTPRGNTPFRTVTDLSELNVQLFFWSCDRFI